MGATEPNARRSRRELLSGGGTRKSFIRHVTFRYKRYEFVRMCACLLARSVFCHTCFTSHFLSSFIPSFLPSFYSLPFLPCFFAMRLTKYPWSLPYAYTRLLHLYVSIWIRIRPGWRSSGEKKKYFSTYLLCREPAVSDSTNLATGSDLACENSARRTNYYRPCSRDRKRKNGYFESFGRSSKCTYKNCNYLSKKIGSVNVARETSLRKYNDKIWEIEHEICWSFQLALKYVISCAMLSFLFQENHFSFIFNSSKNRRTSLRTLGSFFFIVKSITISKIGASSLQRCLNICCMIFFFTTQEFKILTGFHRLYE